MENFRFLSDLYLPQMLYAMTIRSPVAKGRLKAIECPKLPGSYALIRAEDIPGRNSLDNSGMPVLAADQLSYIGEPVALLLGPNKNTLEEYIQQCSVIVEEEEPVFSTAEANAAMIAAQRDTRMGDPETAFAQASSVVRGSYSSGIQEHWYAEPLGAVSWPNDKALVVCTATQWPFHVRHSVAQALGLSASVVQVMPSVTGLHMDGKFWYPSLVSCHAALGSWLTKKPVRLTLTRREDFSFTPKRCATDISIASALDASGSVTGIEINATVNLGAYAVNADEILDHVNLGILGVYKTKNFRFKGVAVRTNIPPQGPFAGFGLAQGFFARECHVSHLADGQRKDPAKWRKENVLKTGLQSKEPVPAEQLLDVAAKMSDYSRKWESYELLRLSRKHTDSGQRSPDSQSAVRMVKGESLRGIGIAAGYQANGLLHIGRDKGSYTIDLTLDKEGILEIKTSMANSGMDCRNMWAGIASKILSLDPEAVQINCDGNYPDSGPSTVSRSASVIAKLIEQACDSIRKKRLRDPLPISVRKIIRTQKTSPLETGISEYYGLIRPSCAVAVVEIEINPIEFLPQIRGVWMGVDGGKIISEDHARRSLKTSAVQALGWAYREQINYVDGVIPPDQFDDFVIPGPQEIPPITIEFISGNTDEIKGIGDLPFSCIPAAYVQAVSQAMDYHFESVPLNAMDIWYAGKNKKENPA
jgi:CO/xanthine dehydrogenase Mo-binding subunit